MLNTRGEEGLELLGNSLVETGGGDERVGKRCALLPDLTLHTDDSEERAGHTTHIHGPGWRAASETLEELLRFDTS